MPKKKAEGQSGALLNTFLKKRVAITGKLAVSRRVAIERQKTEGATYMLRVMRRTEILLVGERRPPDCETRKLRRAKELSI